MTSPSVYGVYRRYVINTSSVSNADVFQEEWPPSYNFNDAELFPSVKKLACDEGPTPIESYDSSLQIAVAVKHTLLDITNKSRNICFYNTPMTSSDYDLITAELSDLAMHACIVNQYLAHLMCKKNPTRNKLDFIDYMKAACRHLDKAQQILEQYDEFCKLYYTLCSTITDFWIGHI